MLKNQILRSRNKDCNDSFKIYFDGEELEQKEYTMNYPKYLGIYFHS